ncbi:MAG: QueT transporter family protein [Rubrobacteridae bacterium]|nr:QueT transporter family protein [Rubrobacteridae bacterium]
MRDKTVWLTRGGLIAALYVVLTITPPLNTISFGQVQFRISEALNVLAFFEPAAIPGLFVGCILANAAGIALGSGLGPLDVVWGTFLTLISAMIIWKSKKPLLGLIAPVILNAFGVALELHYLLKLPFWPSVVFVGIGEAAVVYLLGYPLLVMLLKRHILVRDEVFNKKMES